jgi:hypothetical protein
LKRIRAQGLEINFQLKSQNTHILPLVVQFARLPKIVQFAFYVFRQLEGHSGINPVLVKSLPVEVDKHVICKIGSEFESREFARQLDLKPVDIPPNIFFVFHVAIFKPRPVGPIERTQAAPKRDIHVGPVFPAPVAVAFFQEYFFVIESEVYPVRETPVHKPKIRVVIVEVAGIVAKLKLLFNGNRPVLIQVKRRDRRLPELKVSVLKSKTAPVMTYGGCDHHKKVRCGFV